MSACTWTCSCHHPPPELCHLPRPRQACVCNPVQWLGLFLKQEGELTRVCPPFLLKTSLAWRFYGWPGYLSSPESQEHCSCVCLAPPPRSTPCASISSGLLDLGSVNPLDWLVLCCCGLTCALGGCLAASPTPTPQKLVVCCPLPAVTTPSASRP